MTFEEKTLSTELIYKGQILNLRKDKVKVKGGGYSYREIVEHDGGSVAVPITDDNKVILVKQFRKAMEKDVIELPAGKIESDEEPLETVVRELKEETGYTANNIKLICEFNPSVGYTKETLYIFLATGLSAGDMSLDDDEALEIMEVDFNLAIEMILEGKITDGKTIAGILIAQYHMDR